MIRSSSNSNQRYLHPSRRRSEILRTKRGRHQISSLVVLTLLVMSSSILLVHLAQRVSAKNLLKVAFATSTRISATRSFPRRSITSQNYGGATVCSASHYFKARRPISSSFLNTSPTRCTSTTLLQAKTKRAASTKTTISTTTKTRTRPYKLVIVESPSKCNTIEKILQNHVTTNNLPYDYVVTSCYGHLRNLPKNNQQLLEAGLQVPEKTTSDLFPYSIVGVDLENDYEPTYVMLPGKEALLKELQDLSGNAEHVLLATDPDREGEAIAWHLQQVLGLTADNSERLTFTEITPRAIEAAITDPESTGLNMNLVQAQETRRILDRLAGFTVSPILWKKIAPGLSAGRVQSVGMALVVQRERERLLFQSMDYWDIRGNFSLANDIVMSDADFIQATLSSINGTSLVSGKADFEEVIADGAEIKDGKRPKPQPKPNKYILTISTAADLAKLLQDPATSWQVKSVSGRERLSYPPEPFKTSTLQQESNQRLGMSVAQTMRTAQQLYEAGWISYMRTDSTYLSDDAQAATLQGVTERHGPQLVNANASNNGKKKSHRKKQKSSGQAAKVAQEAHEAIRPAIQENGSFASTEDITKVSESALSLYDLILRRTLSSRMQPQKTNQTTILIEGTAPDGRKVTTTVEFRATGSVVLEAGFTLEWNRGDASGTNRVLPPVSEGQNLACHDLEPISHTTQPPPRYTEASLVKELEALGVGRPSTYAGIVQLLRDRAYVGSPTADGSSSRSANQRKATGSAITAQRAAGGSDLFGARGPLAPSLSAFVVTSLLEQHCPTYVDPSFTANMEENLDHIARGDGDGEGDKGGAGDEASVMQQRVAYLNEFYAGENGLAAQVKRIDEEVDAEVARRANLPALNQTEYDNKGQDIGVYIGPWGPYIQQKSLDESKEPVKASLPPGMATDLSAISFDTLKALIDTKQSDGTILGKHPDDGRNIRLKVGSFGAFLQWGETGEEGTTTHSLPKQMSAMQNLQKPNGEEEAPAEDVPAGDTSKNVDSGEAPDTLNNLLGISLEAAVGYCGLPRTVSTLDDKPIIAAIGPYGPYLKYNNKFMSLHPRDGDVLSIDAETAERLVADGIINRKSGPGRGVIAELGEKDGSMVTVKKGRFGDYLNWKKVNAKLPTEYIDEPDKVPLEEAWLLIQEKAKSTPVKGSKKKAESNLPPAPKRPKSSYLYYCAEKRPEVAKTIKSLGDISKKLAEMWAATSPEERVKYDDMARAEKEKYSKEKASWEEECSKLGGKKTGKSGVSAGPPPPKRAKSAYLYFCEAKRPEVSQTVTKLGDVSKKLAEMWAETTDRDEYIAQAEADKARYEEENIQYAKDLHPSASAAASTSCSEVEDFQEHVVLKTANSRKKKTTKGTKVATKSKRAPSAYMIFCRETRHEIVDEKGDKLPLGETTKRLAERWKDCDLETRAKFGAMAEEEKKKLMVAS